LNDASPLLHSELEATQRPPQRRAWLWVRRSLVLSSAMLVALIVSGGIFVFTPIFGLRIAHTQGISMEPGFREGDVVLIRDLSGEDAEIGDVIVFEAIGLQIMHRVIEEHTGPNGEPILITQGDNVPVPDFPIQASQVNGKLVGKIPIFGWISRQLDAQGGFFVYRSAVLSIAITAIAVWAISTTAGRRREARAEAEAGKRADAIEQIEE
jgi:signal peptidase I